MTDMYVPFTIVITPSGKMSIDRDEEAVDVPLSEQPEPEDTTEIR